jgi:hypothetical protein
MDLYVIRRLSAWANLAELEAAGARSAKVGNQQMSDRVRWIRSYVIEEPDGRLGTVCIYEARDPESIREHARRVGMPADQIFPVATTVIVRPDPVPAPLAAKKSGSASELAKGALATAILLGALHLASGNASEPDRLVNRPTVNPQVCLIDEGYSRTTSCDRTG